MGSASVTPGFRAFLKSRDAALVYIPVSVLQLLALILFRWAYPWPMTTSDTGSYILVARNGTYSGFRPEGYSWVLDFFHQFSQSFVSVAWFQFIAYALSLTFFLLVIRWMIPFRYSLFMGMAFFAVISPFSWYLTHWAMSDSVFISLTLIWLSTLIISLLRFNPYLFILHILIALLAVYVRFAGLIYPLITVAIMFITYRKTKIWWALLPLVVPVLVYSNLKQETEKLYGVSTFSAFSGWARANNASIIIPHIRNEAGPADPMNRYVHQVITAFPDSLFSRQHTINTSFMWGREFPGKAVMFNLASARGYPSYSHAWVHAGTVLGDYGNWLIKKHPGKYFRHFVLMNTGQLFWPEVTVAPFEIKEADDQLTGWYNDDFPVMNAHHDFMKDTGLWLKLLNLVLWCAGVLAGIWTVLKHRVGKFRNIYLGLLLFAVVFAAFSIAAHPVHLRYLMPVYPVLALLMFSPFTLTEKAKR